METKKHIMNLLSSLVTKAIAHSFTSSHRLFGESSAINMQQLLSGMRPQATLQGVVGYILRPGHNLFTSRMLPMPELRCRNYRSKNSILESVCQVFFADRLLYRAQAIVFTFFVSENDMFITAMLSVRVKKWLRRASCLQIHIIVELPHFETRL